MQAERAAVWPTVARDDEFHRALSAVDDTSGFRGVALIGRSGVGKSTLARAVAQALESRGSAIRFVLGTQTGRDVPLGAFSRAVRIDAAQEPVAMLASAHAALEQQGNLVVVVDDAQLLDPLSATLIHQLAAGGTTRLILTIQSGGEIPESVTALLGEGWLRSLRIDPFTRDQTAQLADALLDGTVEPRLVDELQRRSGGNLLLLRGLLSAGRENGVLVRTDVGWRLHGPLQPGSELRDLIGFRLHSLTAEELTVVEILAVADLLDWQVLRELCDTAAAERLERRGMIQLIADGPNMVAELNHPVIGEVAMELAGVVRSREINGVLAQAFQRHLAADQPRLRLPDVRGRIRLAQFMMRSDLAPDPVVIVDAAESAMTLANIAAGEDLSRFALAHGAGLPAAVILADALRWRGRGAEAEGILSAFDPDGSDPLETARWGCLRAANLFEGCGRVGTARRLLAEVRARVEGTPAVALATATEVSFDFFSGDVTAAAELGLSLCSADAHPLATVWAAAPATWALALIGRFADVHRVARLGLQATGCGGIGPQILIIGLAEAAAQAAAGDLAAADQVVERYAAGSAGMPEAEAVIDAVRGHVQLTRGALSSACAALHRSVSTLSSGFQPAVLLLAAAWCAQAEGERGDAKAAAAALRHAEDIYGPQVAVFLPELELARAWVRAAAGQTTAAQQHALRAARSAGRAGMSAMELRARHAAVRFGDRAQAARLRELAETCPGVLPEAIAAHACGVSDRDGELLDAAAGRFAGLGAMAMAADAAAHAAVAHARAGSRERELESASRARQLSDRAGLNSPATSAVARPLPITAREREIAAMAAAGLPNREIAERISVSVRTVDGHLYRIFAKLDIRNREQLKQLFAIAETHPDQVFSTPSLN